MRCKRCGGIVKFLVLGIKGNSFYLCIRGLTTRKLEGKDSAITPCRTVHDQYGHIFTGHIAFPVGKKVETLFVQDGYIK